MEASSLQCRHAGASEAACVVKGMAVRSGNSGDTCGNGLRGPGAQQRLMSHQSAMTIVPEQVKPKAIGN